MAIIEHHDALRLLDKHWEAMQAQVLEYDDNNVFFDAMLAGFFIWAHEDQQLYEVESLCDALCTLLVIFVGATTMPDHCILLPHMGGKSAAEIGNVLIDEVRGMLILTGMFHSAGLKTCIRECA